MNKERFLEDVKATVDEEIALKSIRQKARKQIESQEKQEKEKEEAKEMLEELGLLLYSSISEYRKQEEGISKPIILPESTINILSKVINSENYFVNYFFKRNSTVKEYFEGIINSNEAEIYPFEVNTRQLMVFCEVDLNFFLYSKEEGKYVNKIEILQEEI